MVSVWLHSSSTDLLLSGGACTTGNFLTGRIASPRFIENPADRSLGNKGYLK